MVITRSIHRLAIVLLLAGCSSSGDSDYLYDAADFRPGVDTSLPPEMQAKQDALIRAFKLLQEGRGKEELEEVYTDIRLIESSKRFYGEGAQLHLFEWNGPPSGDDLPVRMVMIKDEPGLPKVEYERVYSVTNKSSVFVIRRKK